MKTMFTAAIMLLFALSGSAQKAKDIIHSDKPITWLGMDFTQTKFIGTANQFKDVGEITEDQLRDKYIPGWNDLFVSEQKKFDVAKYVHRESVSFAMDVTAKANDNAGADFFSGNPSDYAHLKEADIAGLVKKYNFMGNKGVGLVFFIEGMSKGKEEASAWVTFVDMGTKTVLETRRVTGKPGGFGFRNFWAKAFLGILKDADSH